MASQSRISLPLRETRFVLDVHLGRLARYLRMLGFDTRWDRDAADEELAASVRSVAAQDAQPH